MLWPFFSPARGVICSLSKTRLPTAVLVLGSAAVGLVVATAKQVLPAPHVALPKVPVRTMKLARENPPLASVEVWPTWLRSWSQSAAPPVVVLHSVTNTGVL